MVALNQLVDERSVRKQRAPSSKYIIKPLEVRVKENHERLVLRAIQKEIKCGCDWVFKYTCTACDEAMECQCDPDPNREGTACLVCRMNAQVRAETRGEEIPY